MISGWLDAWENTTKQVCSQIGVFFCWEILGNDTFGYFWLDTFGYFVGKFIELDDGKILTGKPYINDGKNPWVSGVDFPQQTNPMRNFGK